MFVDEAKVAMRLNHPNIVQVYAFEQVRREFLLAMEFVDGLDLGRWSVRLDGLVCGFRSVYVPTSWRKWREVWITHINAKMSVEFRWILSIGM